MTEQGGRILEHARKLLRDAADLRSIATEEDARGELRIGACTTPLIGILPGVLARVSQAFPEITVHIRTANSALLYREVESGDLDAAFVLEAPFPLPKTCSWTMLREEPLVVLAPLAMAGAHPHDLLRSEPFIRYDRNQWGGRSADTYLRRARIVPRERFEMNALNPIALLVDRGLGVSLVPDWAPPWPAGLSLARLPLPRKIVARRIGIVWSLSSVRERLVKILREESLAACAPERQAAAMIGGARRA